MVVPHPPSNPRPTLPTNYSKELATTNMMTLLNTGASTNLRNILSNLSPEALSNYKPYQAIRVDHNFTRDITICGFYENNTLTEATESLLRLKKHKLKIKEERIKLTNKFNESTLQIAKINKLLSVKERKTANFVITILATIQIQNAFRKKIAYKK